jgi:transketolase
LRTVLYSKQFRLNFIDVATGSLGQGLSVAAGMAYAAKHFDKASYRTYCLMGDGESMEGNIWEVRRARRHIDHGRRPSTLLASTS